MVILSVFIICVCILNYNNKDAKFSFENYIIELSENISYLPKPPDVSSFKSFTQYVEDIDDKNAQGLFLIGSLTHLVFYGILYVIRLRFYFG